MNGLRDYWRVPVYVMGAVVLLGAVARGGWLWLGALGVGLLSAGLYLLSLRLPDWRNARVAEEIRRNQERRRFDG